MFANSPLDAKSRGRLLGRAPPDRSLTRWRGQVSPVATLLQSPLGSLAPSGRSGRKQLALLGVAKCAPPERLRFMVGSLPEATLDTSGPQSVRHYILPDTKEECAAHNLHRPTHKSVRHSLQQESLRSPKDVRCTISVQHKRKCAAQLPKGFQKTAESFRHPTSVRNSIPSRNPASVRQPIPERHREVCAATSLHRPPTSVCGTPTPSGSRDCVRSPQACAVHWTERLTGRQGHGTGKGPGKPAATLTL